MLKQMRRMIRENYVLAFIGLHGKGRSTKIVAYRDVFLRFQRHPTIIQFIKTETRTVGVRLFGVYNGLGICHNNTGKENAMRYLTVRLFCLLVISTSATAAVLSVKPADYWVCELSCEVDADGKRSLTAHTTITQPQGYSQVLDAPVKVIGGRAHWELEYPLIDEGRFDVKRGDWDGYWDMGAYQFRTELKDGDEVIQRAQGTFDPTLLCQRDYYGPIITKYPQQFIECSPERPAYINTEWMSFTIRTLPDRVAACTVVVDVLPRDFERAYAVAAQGSSEREKEPECLAGPWTMQLTGDRQRKEFVTKGWPRGEYWIRIRLQRNGLAVGPYVIRKVWKEILPPEPCPPVPRRIGTPLQLLAGPYGFDSVRDIRFVTEALKKRPGTLLTMEKPWESELMFFKHVRYSDQKGEYLLQYAVGEGDVARKEEYAQLPSRTCLAVSRDAVHWTKPNLGLVNYRGSTDNNLIPSGQEDQPRLRPGVLSHDFEKATFRFYDANRDGLINMDHVFMSAVKRSFVRKCQHSSAKPFRAGSWPMEKRGNEYLVLTREAQLFLGIGMDLYHSSESIRCCVENKSNGRLLYYFRPGAPAYAPHDAPYDNMHMIRRVMAVMWSDNGTDWHRRFVAVGEESDPMSTELYVMTVFPEAEESVSGRPALALENHKANIAVDGDRVYLGALFMYDAKAGRQWPETIWSRDLIHWHRFDKRTKMIENGPWGSHDYGMIKIQSKYYVFGDEWWFPYTAINQVKQDYIGLGRTLTLEQLRTEYPNYSEMPGFTNWEEYWKRCKSMRYYPALARCKVGRVCHAEPLADSGQLTTTPVVLDGEFLAINARTEKGGSVRVELLDADGQPLAGFDSNASLPFQGDAIAHLVQWRDARLDKLPQDSVRVRFLLERAKLYAFHVQ